MLGTAFMRGGRTAFFILTSVLTLDVSVCQVVNLVSNKLATILGRVENTERFLRLALYQGAPKKVSW